MTINWTDNALQDLNEIKAYIARDSDFYATRFIEKLIDGVGSLSSFPEMGRKVPEAQSELIRELIYRPYRIIYKINKNYIDIITVVNSHMDLNNPSLQKWEIG
jgi:addiction module RelE/StbE family toxin